MASVGIHSSPAFWVLGAAGLVFGRLLLHSGFGLRRSGDGPADIEPGLHAASPIFRESGGPSSQEQAETAWFASATKL
jgi:hypothetical protein